MKFLRRNASNILFSLAISGLWFPVFAQVVEEMGPYEFNPAFCLLVMILSFGWLIVFAITEFRRLR